MFSLKNEENIVIAALFGPRREKACLRMFVTGKSADQQRC